MYFKLESIETIANHIMALYGAKVRECGPNVCNLARP